MESLPKPASIYVVAPDICAWGLARLIESAAGRMAFAGSSWSLPGAAADPLALGCDLLLVDEDDPDRLAQLVEFTERECRKVLLLTAIGDEAVLDRAVLAGARGVVRKSASPALLLTAIEKVLGGQLWVNREATGRIFLEMARRRSQASNDPESGRIATLTLRERQTIAAVATDSSAPAKVIADRLCISPHTLRNHLTSIYSKLGVTSRLDLYVYASRHSLHDGRRP